MTEPIGTPHDVIVQLAKSVLVMAANGGMPDTFWLTDSRISLACYVLGMTPYEARDWVQVNQEWKPNSD